MSDALRDTFSEMKGLQGVKGDARVKIKGNYHKKNIGFGLGGGRDLFQGDVVVVSAAIAAMAISAGRAVLIEVLDTPAP